MREYQFRVERLSSAPPQAVFALIELVPGWVKWAPLVGYASLVREGTSRTGGAGARRRVGPFRALSVEEEIIEDRPPNYQRYTVVGANPFSSYIGEIRVESLGDGSAIVWVCRFTTRTIGLGPVLRFLLQRALGVLVNAAVTAAERGAYPDLYRTQRQPPWR